MSPCEASVSGGQCGRPYIEHGPALLAAGSATTPVSSGSVAPPASAWSHPNNPTFPSANAARVDHFTAARDASVPSGPFSNSPSMYRTRGQA
jgi:hypothetical protein